MDNEDAFASEARDEALLSRMQTADSESIRKSRYRTAEDEIAAESAPLLSDPIPPLPRPPAYSSSSYQRAIDEPWHGAYDSADLPWHKKPSVSTARRHTVTDR